MIIVFIIVVLNQFGAKYALLFVHRRNLFGEAQKSFPRTKLKENCGL